MLGHFFSGGINDSLIFFNSIKQIVVFICLLQKCLYLICNFNEQVQQVHELVTKRKKTIILTTKYNNTKLNV